MSDFGKETIKCLDALESAYQKGRADLLMPYDVESVEELIENVQKKVRADAIEEVIKAIDEQNYCMQEKCPFNACRFDGCPINRNAEVIFQTWLKKLKEQKNG